VKATEHLARLSWLSAPIAIVVAVMMQLSAPERDVPRDPAVLRLPPAALLVVAGVPGAGKTTLLTRIDAPGSLVLDPEPIRARLARWLGLVPYRLWRPLVHAEHIARVLLALPGGSGLIVHDTGTRGWRRWLLARLARCVGRGGHLLLLDVTAEAALEGQRERRRTLGPAAFAAHWRRWRRLRGGLAGPAGPGTTGPGAAAPDPAGSGAAGPGLAAEGWASVHLLDRSAADRLGRVEIPARLS
jgi:hypothetical protein